MDRGAWQATVHGVAKDRTQLSDFHFTDFENIFSSPAAKALFLFPSWEVLKQPLDIFRLPSPLL